MTTQKRYRRKATVSQMVLASVVLVSLILGIVLVHELLGHPGHWESADEGTLSAMMVSPSGGGCIHCDRFERFCKDNKIPLYIRKVDHKTQVEEKIQSFPLISIVNVKSQMVGFGPKQEERIKGVLKLTGSPISGKSTR